MKSVNATKFHRKSGGAKPRDLRFRGPFLEMFFVTTVWLPAAKRDKFFRPRIHPL
jgi:hypothetical protein